MRATAKEAAPVLSPCVQATRIVRSGFAKDLAAGQLGSQGIGIDDTGRSWRTLSGLMIAAPELDGGRGDRDQHECHRRSPCRHCRGDARRHQWNIVMVVGW
jgi:hypothetical protein